MLFSLEVAVAVFLRAALLPDSLIQLLEEEVVYFVPPIDRILSRDPVMILEAPLGHFLVAVRWARAKILGWSSSLVFENLVENNSNIHFQMIHFELLVRW